VEPNPRVGALLVYQDHILAEAYHPFYGGPHAERLLYEQLLEREQAIPWHETTLYISLEPCTHYGKQPPCTHLILQKPPRQVVIADIDPNPVVRGKGVQLLKNAGISLLLLPLPEARWLNRHFYVNIHKQRPYITVKWAQSRNGIMGSSRERLFITDSYSQLFAHRLRAEHQAILIGVNTLRIDQPRLNTRFAVGPSPIPIILAHKVPDSKLFQPLSTLHSRIFLLNAQVEKEDPPFSYLLIDGQPLEKICQRLYQAFAIGSILIEGGYQTITNFFREDLVDEVFVFHSLAAKEGDVKAPPLPSLVQFECLEVNQITEETILFHFVSKEVLELMNPFPVSGMAKDDKG